jgi:hypothetical protein
VPSVACTPRRRPRYRVAAPSIGVSSAFGNGVSRPLAASGPRGAPSNHDLTNSSWSVVPTRRRAARRACRAWWPPGLVAAGLSRSEAEG